MKRDGHPWCLLLVATAAMGSLSSAQAAPRPKVTNVAEPAPPSNVRTEGTPPQANDSSAASKRAEPPSKETGDSWSANDPATASEPAADVASGDTAPQNPVAPPPPQVARPLPPRMAFIPDGDGAPVELDDESAESPWPQDLDYIEGVPAPPGYRLEESKLKGLIIGGIIPLSAFYLLSFSVAQDNHFRGAAGWLALPVVGPYAWLADYNGRHTCNGDVCYNSVDSLARALVVFDAVIQTGTAAMFITGLAVTRKRWVLVNQASLHVLPYAAHNAGGLSMLGQF